MALGLGCLLEEQMGYLWDAEKDLWMDAELGRWMISPKAL